MDYGRISQNNMKISVKPDKEKAKSLLFMARLTLERLKETDKPKYPSHTLTDYYDIIHNLMESLSLIKGVKIKSEGAHQELIEYTCRTYQVSEESRLFLQNLRNLRNRIVYEGFFIKPNYLEANENHILLLIDKLESLINQQLKNE